MVSAAFESYVQVVDWPGRGLASKPRLKDDTLFLKVRADLSPEERKRHAELREKLFTSSTSDWREGFGRLARSCGSSSKIMTSLKRSFILASVRRVQLWPWF